MRRHCILGWYTTTSSRSTVMRKFILLLHIEPLIMNPLSYDVELHTIHFNDILKSCMHEPRFFDSRQRSIWLQHQSADRSAEGNSARIDHSTTRNCSLFNLRSVAITSLASASWVSQAMADFIGQVILHLNANDRIRDPRWLKLWNTLQHARQKVG